MGKKILISFGTRPEAIKMAPLVKALKNSKKFNVKICVTAQHRQLLDQVLKTFNLKPDFDLDLMKQKQDLFDITSSVMLGMKSIISKETPDIILVHGDTTTTFATSLAAFYSELPVGHIEAGLRTYDLKAPFPEEFNRQITSKITKWHFAPTKLSRDNLISENVDPSTIYVTGNTVIDALIWVLNQLKIDSKKENALSKILIDILKFDFKKKRYVLITGHRRENFGDGFNNICKAIYNLAKKFPDINFVYPVHLNPNVQSPVKKLLSNLANVKLIRPLDYEPFIYLLSYSYFVLTDSGGIQEEAPSLGKPVLVMRDVTERPEAVEAGTVKLVGSDSKKIVNNVSILLNDTMAYHKMSISHNPYGNGTSCAKIIKILDQL